MSVSDISKPIMQDYENLLKHYQALMGVKSFLMHKLSKFFPFLVSLQYTHNVENEMPSLFLIQMHGGA
jgi:hypothetical protein